ncbi:MAG: hypothetical protein CM15mP120_23140 [Pseudomonadota bacterium]|nr:MAG: hypothetical protein CM15mP120_23140 [Pseudomonadota bacterium]
MVDHRYMWQKEGLLNQDRYDSQLIDQYQPAARIFRSISD